MAFSINRDGVVPRYYQLKQRIKQEIADGTLADKIPSERELAAKHGLAHMTVRRAVSELVEEGFLYREVGKGTFVCGVGRPARRTLNIGFVLSDIVADGASNPYFSVVLRGVQRACAERGFNVIFSTEIEDVLPLEETGPLGQRRRKVDAIVAVAIPEQDADGITRASRFVPTVTLDCSVQGVPAFLADNAFGGEQATRYLLELGHVRIGHLAGAHESVAAQGRLAGYRRALEEAGIRYDPALIHEAGFRFDSGYEGVGEILSLGDPPTAIFCANDAVALGAMKRMGEMGLDVPRDVSVVGFDDIEACTQVVPSLTTVATPKEEIAVLAAGALFRALDGRAADGEEPPRCPGDAVDPTGPRRPGDAVDPTGPRRPGDAVDPTGPRARPTKKSTSQETLVKTRLVERESCGSPPRGSRRVRTRRKKPRQ